MDRAFRSLRNPNYRLWAAGALVSNVGTWMQRVAQDWLVLTYLTNKQASTVGIVMALQFGPQILLLPLTGFAADHFDRRKLLIATQATMGTLALGLGLLTISGVVELWHVFVFAFLLGCTAAFDTPARQTFVSELVGEADLANAVGLNSASFNAARLIGPAVAGMLISGVGPGWVFLINAGSFVAVIASLLMLRTQDLHRGHRAARGAGSLSDGFRYVWGRGDLKVVLTMEFLIGTFGLNFAIYISTMVVTVFGGGAHQYGILTSLMAIGSITGALLTARTARSTIERLMITAVVFGLGCAIAALMPGYALFGAALILTGVAAQTFTTSTNTFVQLSTEPAMRGRVLAILFAVFMGGTPLGAPLVGWVADQFGPRWALAVGAAAGFAAAATAILYIASGSRAEDDEATKTDADIAAQRERAGSGSGRGA